MNIDKRIIYVCIFSFAAAWASSNQEALSRGGGGGRGFGGGGRGFDSGFDSRADQFLRGDDGYGRATESDRFGGYPESNLSSDRPDSFSEGTRVSDTDLRAAADHEYSTGGLDHPISTDAGFGRVAMAQPGARIGRVSSQDLAGRGNAVRQSFGDYNMYDRSWWNNHPYAWRYPYYGNSAWPWGYSGWGAFAGFWGMSAGMDLPLYDYGDNITFNNDEVYYGSQPTCTQQQYYSQAQTLAQSVPPTSTLVSSQPSGSFTIDGQPPNANDWRALGVFSLTQGGQTNSTSIFQLAVDKAGVIRGNYTNELTGNVDNVQGAVDKKSMRASWTVGDNQTVVYDTGLSTLLASQGTVLVHFSKDRMEQWTLVRLQPPKSAAKTG